MRIYLVIALIVTVFSYQNCKVLDGNKIEWTVNYPDSLDMKITFNNTKGYGYVSIGFNSKGNTMGAQGNVILGFSNNIYEYMMIGFMAPVSIPKSCSNDTLSENGTNQVMKFTRPLKKDGGNYFEIKNETTTVMFAFHDKVTPNNENEIPQHTKTSKFELNWFTPENSC